MFLMLKGKELIKGFDHNPVGTVTGAFAAATVSRKLGFGWLITTGFAVGGALAGGKIEEKIKQVY